MRYYIIDNNGTIYGECNNKPEAEFMTEVYKDQLKAQGKTEAQVEALKLKVIEK